MATAITLIASASRTGSGSGTPVDLGDQRQAELLASVTVSPVSAPLILTIETSHDQAEWVPALAFDGRRMRGFSVGSTPAPSSERLVFAGLRRYLRASYEVRANMGHGVTFSVIGETT